MDTRKLPYSAQEYNFIFLMEVGDFTHNITHLFGAVSKSIAALLCLLSSAVLASQSTPGRKEDGTMNISHTTDFELKGDGSAPEWNATEWITLSRRGTPTVSYNTTIKVLYSDKGIYFLFRCEDKKITATLTEDFADLYREDVVEVFLWPNESVPVYFEYELSPLNYELAIMVPNYDGDFFGWRPWHYEGDRLTRHATHISKEPGDATWTAEMFIPYALLKPLIPGPPAKGDRWRANFYRLDYDDGNTRWSWQPYEKNFHDYKNFGTIVFK